MTGRIKKFLEKLGICTSVIVLANVVSFILTELFGPSSNTSYLIAHGALSWDEVINNHEYYRLFTYMFLHGGLEHIANNMIVFAFVGSALEKTVGRLRFTAIYLLSGIGAGAVSILIGQMEFERMTLLEQLAYAYPVSVGASGAVFGVVGAMVYVVIRNKGRVENISRQQLVIFLVLSLYAGFTGTGIDNAAHVGGAVLGLALAALLYRPPKRETDGRDVRL